MNKPTTQQIIAHYGLERLPVESTRYKKMYASEAQMPCGDPCGTAIIAMYSNNPLSRSLFHKLTYDEVWHFYGGDAFYLHLIYPDGRYERITMGGDVLAGQAVQFVIPAGVWQAGEISEDGEWSLFGCTMAPGFVPHCFEAMSGEELCAQFSQHEGVIMRLSVGEDDERQIPEDFEK